MHSTARVRIALRPATCDERAYQALTIGAMLLVVATALIL